MLTVFLSGMLVKSEVTSRDKSIYILHGVRKLRRMLLIGHTASNLLHYTQLLLEDLATDW